MGFSQQFLINYLTKSVDDDEKLPVEKPLPADRGRKLQLPACPRRESVSFVDRP